MLNEKEKAILNATANGSNSGKGFTPKAKGDRTTDTQPEATTQPEETTAPESPTEKPFDLTPVIAAATELVGQEAVDARVAEYREDELTDQEIAGYLPRWAARKASKVNALAVATQSNKTIATTQKTGLENATAFIQKQQAQRNQLVDQVSDAIAYLSDPDLLEADIMSAAAAKVAARSNAWGYAEPLVDFDNLFALPASSQRMLNGV